MKIVIVGGHFSPALSVIESLDKKDDIFYFGRKTTFEGDKAVSLEYNEILTRNIPFFPITSGRLQRKISRFTLISLSKLPIGLVQSVNLLKKIKPDLVLGFGGYISIPVCLSAKLLKIPIVIHEQTLEAGFANKFISKFANLVLISWEESRKFFPKEKTILTGNPLTKEVVDAKEEKAQGKSLPTIYITGGSTGSHFINTILEKNLENLLKYFFIIHQTGDSRNHADYERFLEKKKTLNKNLKIRYELKKFLSPKEAAFTIRSADMVIGRAGINMVSELIYFKKPAILIPLVSGQKNEQYKNAIFLKDLGLAEILDQNNLTDEDFTKKIFSMYKNIDGYRLKKEVLLENSAEKIVKILNNVSKKKTA